MNPFGGNEPLRENTAAPDNYEGTPRGSPKGSLIQSKPNQSNQTQSIEKVLVPIDDPWVKEYENYQNDYEKASKGY